MHLRNRVMVSACGFESTEAWVLFTAFNKLGQRECTPACKHFCCQHWTSCLQNCHCPAVLAKVLAAAMKDASISNLRECQQQLINKSLAPALSDETACELLEHCLLQGPASACSLSAHSLLRWLDECILDLCCTAVHGTSGLLALKKRECAVLTTLLSSCHGFVADLARQVTTASGGCAGASHADASTMSPSSKLHMLLDACYRSPHATQPSACQAVRLVSACSVADCSTYAMLLPILDTIAGSRVQTQVRLTAFAGIADGLHVHDSRLLASVWQHAAGSMIQMLTKAHQEEEEMQLAAVASIGRLLLHAGDACSEQGQTEQLLSAMVQTYIQPKPDRCTSNTTTTSASANVQQALHLFFQQYADHHADELANTCVLLMCEGIALGLLMWQPLSERLVSGQQQGKASALRMQCKFLMKLLGQSDLPAQAVHEAVCANNMQLSISPNAVADWLHSSHE